MNTYMLYGLLAVLGFSFFFLLGWGLWIGYSNSQAEQSNILYPFSGYLSPSGVWTVNQSKTNKGVGTSPAEGLYLVGMSGGTSADVPQISCPQGYRINIVGAYLDVADPNGTCSPNPNPLVQSSCGGVTVSSGICKDDSECAAGMKCALGKCTPNTCTSSDECYRAGVIDKCPLELGGVCTTVGGRLGNLVCTRNAHGALVYTLDPGAGACMKCEASRCVVYPSCQGAYGGKNEACVSFACKPRDASAYLARHCDGKSVCLGTPTDAWRPNDIGGVFGPLPCQIAAPDHGDLDTNYINLPINTGWAGGAPPQSQTGGGSPVTFTQGYYVHGVYTCVPEGQKVMPE